jgi:multiple antibiotic resistance protein
VGGHIARFLGQGGLKAVSRVFSLLLAAIAVSMIIHGLEMLNILST